MIQTDTFIEIGSQHHMCEDYIINGNNHIILADGCSSSDHSEMGARFLSYMAQQFLKKYGVYPRDRHFKEEMPRWIIHNAENLARQLGLEQTCLDATLIISYIHNDEIHVHMYGDGCVILQLNDHEYKLFEVQYKANHKSMPYYLRYELDMKGKQSYHDAKVTKTLHKTCTDVFDLTTEKIPEEIAYDHPCHFSFDISEYKSISIASDGLGTFVNALPDEEGNKIMKTSDMVPSIFSFPSSTGVFLQRQINICKRTLKKANLQWNHFDDLSIGTYLIEDE